MVQCSKFIWMRHINVSLSSYTFMRPLRLLTHLCFTNWLPLFKLHIYLCNIFPGRKFLISLTEWTETMMVVFHLESLWEKKHLWRRSSRTWTKMEMVLLVKRWEKNTIKDWNIILFELMFRNLQSFASIWHPSK